MTHTPSAGCRYALDLTIESEPGPFDSRAAATERFNDREGRAHRGTQIIENRLRAADVHGAGVSVSAVGTHVWVHRSGALESTFNPLASADLLESIGIAVSLASDPSSALLQSVPSGVRFETSPLVSRGFGDGEFIEVADIIALVIASDLPPALALAVRERVAEIAQQFPERPGFRQTVGSDD